ncbi:UNVERIFIED_CONTAM: hypothetical protein HHA_255470 [Hammondia hammondi]|eukprot:XP_008888697.1 hypothetical protein HHA_255470 [Hammondia hammondi]
MALQIFLFSRARRRILSRRSVHLASSPVCPSRAFSVLPPPSPPSSPSSGVSSSLYTWSSPSVVCPSSPFSPSFSSPFSLSRSVPSSVASSLRRPPTPSSLSSASASGLLSSLSPFSSASSSPLCCIRGSRTQSAGGDLGDCMRFLGTAAGRETGDGDKPPKPIAPVSETDYEEQRREKREVLLLHVLFKGGPRGHVKGMRRKTKEEILWEVREAIGLARAANWRVVRGPGATEDSERPSWQRSLWEDKDEENACASEGSSAFLAETEGPAGARRPTRESRGNREEIEDVNEETRALSRALQQEAGANTAERIEAEPREHAGPSRGVEVTATHAKKDSLAQVLAETRTRKEKKQKRRNAAEEQELALAESCVVVVRHENPQFLFGKGKLQEIVSFFSKRPTPFVFINCSNAFTSIPLPESLAEVHSQGVDVSAASSSSDGAWESSRRSASPPGRDTSSSSSSSASSSSSSCGSSPLFGQYGYYSKNRSIAGRLMMSSSNDKTSAGLRPVQLEYLQQAFEASLAGAAAEFEERRRRERAEGPATSRHVSLSWSARDADREEEDEEGDDENDGDEEDGEEECGGERGSGEEVEDDSEDVGEEINRVSLWLRRREKVQVVDRQRVILEIFTSQARNKKAMLQVALARVAYLRSRLLSGSEVRRRQLFELIYGASKIRGCAPGTQVTQWLGEVTEQYIPSPRGPKEDFERQYVDSLMKRLRGQVAQEAATLEHQRRSRSGLPCLALVGYTNAGKSRLINALTKNGQLRSEDRLFCTLDTKMKHLRLPNGSKCVLMDSIGFIQGLPLSLCGAFQATLDELHHADILLHVVDVSHPMWQHQRRVVLQALYQNAKTVATRRKSAEEQIQSRELLRQQLQAPLPAFSRCFLEGGENEEGQEGERPKSLSLLHAVDAEQAFEETKLVERVMGNTRIIEVWNKVDLVESDTRMAAIARLAPLNAVLVSAEDGTGLDLLTQLLQDGIAETRRAKRVRLAKVEFPAEHAQGVFSFITQHCQVGQTNYETEET